MGKSIQVLIDSLPPDDRMTLKSFVDASVSKAIKSYATNHPTPEFGYKALAERLDKIDMARQASELKADIKIEAIKLCTEKNISFGIVEDLLPMFTSKEALTKKISELASLSTEQKTRQANAEMANGFKPGRANEKPSTALKDFSPSEMTALESAGMLDALIKGY